MNTAYATSSDGLAWQWHGTVLSGRPGEWDARGARLTTVLPDGRAADVRYLDALPLPGGGYRIFYEARLPDESHELRTELID
jgi:hypothetical protein